MQSVFSLDIENRMTVPAGYRPPGEVCQDLARTSAPTGGNIAVRFRGRNDAGEERQSHRPKNRGAVRRQRGRSPFPPSESPHDSFAARRDESVIVGLHALKKCVTGWPTAIVMNNKGGCHGEKELHRSPNRHPHTS